MDFSIPFFLGYDVWVGNVRGNSYGVKKGICRLNWIDVVLALLKGTLEALKDLKPCKHGGDQTFWDFTFEDFGKVDVPAQIDYILEKTKADKVSYIGFGEGAASYAVSQRVNKTSYLQSSSKILFKGDVE